MMSVRAATEDDIPRILEIEIDSISPPWTHGALLGEIYRDDCFFSVIDEHSHSVSGFVILRQVSEDEGELLQIAVCKAAQRHGFAGSLMSAALRYAEERSFKTIFLEVRKSNEAAIALYKKHGFKSVRVRKDYYRDPTEDALVMARSNQDSF